MHHYCTLRKTLTNPEPNYIHTRWTLKLQHYCCLMISIMSRILVSDKISVQKKSMKIQLTYILYTYTRVTLTTKSMYH